MGEQHIIPPIMRAWVGARSGKPSDILSLKTDYPTPRAPGAGEIMVRVSYVSLNPGDVKLFKDMSYRRNFVPAMDFAGEVVQMGPVRSGSPQGIDIGTLVAGTVPLGKTFRGIGTMAEYIVVSASMVVIPPNHLDNAVAAGLFGVAGQTNARLFKAAEGLTRGDRVLVNGASGGVGCLLIQWLHAVGVHITGTCSSRNIDFVKKLGVDEVVDYTAHESLYDHLRSRSTEGGAFDCIFDLVGDDKLYFRSPEYLKQGGKCICIEKGPNGIIASFLWNHLPTILGGVPRTYVNIMSTPSGSSAQKVADFVEKGWIKEVPVDSIFEMNDALKAFDKVASKRSVGKVLVKIGG